MLRIVGMLRKTLVFFLLWRIDLKYKGGGGRAFLNLNVKCITKTSPCNEDPPHPTFT